MEIPDWGAKVNITWVDLDLWILVILECLALATFRQWSCTGHERLHLSLVVRLGAQLGRSLGRCILYNYTVTLPLYDCIDLISLCMVRSKLVKP